MSHGDISMQHGSWMEREDVKKKKHNTTQQA